MQLAIQFVLTLVLIPLFDFVWIGNLMKSFYMSELGSIARMENGEFKPNLLAAACVYLVMSFGIVVFVLSQSDRSLLTTFLYVAALGFVIYGTYDLTNLSTLQAWTIKLTIVDTLWGTFLCGLVSLIVQYASNKLSF